MNLNEKENVLDSFLNTSIIQSESKIVDLLFEVRLFYWILLYFIFILGGFELRNFCKNKTILENKTKTKIGCKARKPRVNFVRH